MKKKTNFSIIVAQILCFLFMGLFLVGSGTISLYLYEGSVAKDSYTEIRQHVRNNGVSLDQNSLINIDFDALEKINSDIVAWIYCPDSAIDYPVVQGTDNEYYLHHLFNREKNRSGSIFMDTRNQSDFSDTNTIIYGHNTGKETMFASLTKYREQSYYDEHPIMYVITRDNTYQLEFFSGKVVGSESGVWQTNFDGNESVLNWISMIRSGSTFKSDVEITPSDKIITLSTCTNISDEERYILLGKLSIIS